MFVVFVDTSLALIELKQRQRQLPNAGVNFCDKPYAANTFLVLGFLLLSKAIQSGVIEWGLSVALTTRQFTDPNIPDSAAGAGRGVVQPLLPRR